MTESIITPWGYSVEELPPIVDVDTFNKLCPGLSSSSDTKSKVLDAVSAAVRNYCGWHVSPSLECTFVGNGEGDLLMLPGMRITEVSSLAINGASVTDYQWTGAGMVRLNSGLFPDVWRSVECVYTAGTEDAAVLQIVAQIAANHLAAAPGVASERAGDVSITFNSTGSGITGGVSLLPRDYALLFPYVLKRAW